MADHVEPRSAVASPLTVLRCSRLPLSMACPASMVEDDEPRLARNHDLATLGTAAHRVLTSRVIGRKLDTDEVAAEDQVDAGDLSMQVSRGWAVWVKDLAAFFPSPIVERPLSFRDAEAGLLLTGHPDVVSTAALETKLQLRVADFKTGFLDADHENQLKGYAWLCLNEWPGAETVYAAVVRSREGTRDGWVWSREELHRWYVDLLAALKEMGTDYNPDPRWCPHCPRGMSCAAKSAMLGQAADFLLTLPNETSGLTEDEPRMLHLPDDLVARGTLLSLIKDRAKAVADAAEFALRLVKIEVLAAGGLLPTEDGRELVVTEQQQRHIIPSPAWAILRDAIGEERLIEECVKISKGEVETAAKESAGRGAKGKAVMELMAKLESAGAIETTTVQRLETKKQSKKIGVTQ